MSKDIKKFTIKQFREQFSDDNACLDYIFNLKYSNKSKCSKCGHTKSYVRVKNRRCYQCSKCSYQVYPTANTILHKSTTPLTYWFFTIFLFTISKNGLSACELQRHLGVTYKTAYRMLQKIRVLITDKQGSDLFEGIVESDETFVGGKNKNRHKDKKVKNSQGRSFKDKTPVLGIIKRSEYDYISDVSGKQIKVITNPSFVKCFVVNNTSRKSIQPILHRTVKYNSTLMTDEWIAYEGLNRYYNHGIVDHSKRQYVNGDVTTNAIENFWSIVKRTINGSYIHVSKKHLQLYVNEIAFRFNNRYNSKMFYTLVNYLSS